MKNLTKHSISFFLILILAFSFSCTTEDGAQGEQGIPGIDGVDGSDGNANVNSTSWIEPIISDYSVNLSYYKALPITLSDFDKNKDVLLVYLYDQTGLNPAYTYFYMLPHYEFAPTGESLLKSYEINIRPPSSNIYVGIKSYGRDLITREYLWEPDPTDLNKKGVKFRFVVIKGDTNSSRPSNNLKSSKNTSTPFSLLKTKLDSADVNINDYYAVCDYYDIAY